MAFKVVEGGGIAGERNSNGSGRCRSDTVGFSWRFVSPLYIGSALNPINSSLIATALVPIANSAHVSVGRTALLVTGLYLASAVAQPTAGKIAEVYGPRRVFLVGIFLVLLGGILGGFAQSFSSLLCARVLIGLGTSCAYPTAMVLVRRRARAANMLEPPGAVLGGLQIAGLATTALGLPIGGVLVDSVGWRAVFLINVPVTMIALFTTLVWIPVDPPSEESRQLRKVISRIDVVGIIGFSLSMTALLTFLFSLPALSWGALISVVVLWTGLIFWELRARMPFFDVRLLRYNSGVTRTYVRFGLVLFCVYTVLYGLAQWLEEARNISAMDAGLLLLPMGLVSGTIIVPISRRNLVKGPIIASAISCIIGSIGISVLNLTSSSVLIVSTTLAFGVAMGTTSSGHQIALYLQAPADQLGTASGLLRTFGYVGSIASSAATGMVFRSGVSDAGLHQLGLVMLAASIIALTISLADRSLKGSHVRSNDNA